jgi:FtsP/CotA-like multicopper oxidase with cupredoxin domain
LLIVRIYSAAALGLITVPALTYAQETPCTRPAPGSVVTQPEELRSHDGALKLDLTYRNVKTADGREEYCYQSNDGSQAPTLRLQPGDLLILRLKNELTTPLRTDSRASHHVDGMPISQPCVSAQMTPLSTNFHFHGLTVPALCHEDDVLKTVVQPGDAPFAYRFRIPPDEPPGLYWYHPHAHGFTNPQVLGERPVRSLSTESSVPTKSWRDCTSSSS